MIIRTKAWGLERMGKEYSVTTLDPGFLVVGMLFGMRHGRVFILC